MGKPMSSRSMGERKILLTPGCRLLSVLVGATLLMISPGCNRGTEPMIPSYMQDENGEVKQLTPEEIEKVRRDAEELQQKRRENIAP